MKHIKLWQWCLLCSVTFLANPNGYAISLTGLLTVDSGNVVMKEKLDPATGEPVIGSNGKVVMVLDYVTGSLFSMGNIYAAMNPGSAGGLQIGSFQNFILTPDEPHPDGHPAATNGAGTGYENAPPVQLGTAIAPFEFFNGNTYIGTNPLSYQSGLVKNAPAVDLDMASCVGDVCNLTADLSSWEVVWGGSAFEQGPRDCGELPFGVTTLPEGCTFGLATGSYNLVTNAYTLNWSSRIVGGSFNNVIGNWTLEGTHVVPVPAAAWLFGSGLLALTGLARRKHA